MLLQVTNSIMIYHVSDIFDHIIASCPFFGLELYELPSSNEFSSIDNILILLQKDGTL
jgi:hypothetical protein